MLGLEYAWVASNLVTTVTVRDTLSCTFYIGHIRIHLQHTSFFAKISAYFFFDLFIK